MSSPLQSAGPNRASPVVSLVPVGRELDASGDPGMRQWLDRLTEDRAR